MIVSDLSEILVFRYRIDRLLMFFGCGPTKRAAGFSRTQMWNICLRSELSW